MPQGKAGTLTQKQKRLLKEITEVAELCVVDYTRILDYKPEQRTTRLELMKRQLVVGRVVWEYIYVDEMLACAICYFFFGRNRDFPQLWKTKKFAVFNHYIVEILSLTEKLRLVKTIHTVPKAVAANIETLNALRNGLAHAYFPENLRSYKPVYKGNGIYSVEGFQRFVADMTEVTRFLHEMIFSPSRRKQKTQAVIQTLLAGTVTT